MGQKVNPTSLRLHPENKHFDSCWFSEKQYAHSIHKNLSVETYSNAILKQIQYPSASFFLEADPRKCKVSVLFLNPAQLREQVFRQFDSVNGRNKKTRQRALFSAKKKTTSFYGLPKKGGGFLGLLPPSLLTPSFLQNLKNKDSFFNLVPSDLFYKVKKNDVFSDLFDKVKKNGVFLPCKKTIQGQKTKGQKTKESPVFYTVKNTTNLLQGQKASVKHTKRGVPSLEKEKKGEKRNQDLALSSFLQVQRSDLQISPSQRPLQEKTEVADRRANLHSNAPVRGQACTFGEVRKGVWSSVLGLAISRYFVERETSKNLLSATSRFLLLQAFFSCLKIEKKAYSSDVFSVAADSGSFLQSQKQDSCFFFRKNTKNTKNTKKRATTPPSFFDKKESLLLANTKVFPQKKKEDAPLFTPLLPYVNPRFAKEVYKGDLHGKFVNQRNRQESGLFSNLEKSSIYTYHIESIISNRLKSSCSISFFKAQNVAQSALFIAEEIVYQLQRRSTFRQIKSKFLQELGNKPAIKGVRVTCVGRIGGRAKKAQRARGESFKMGQTSLHLFNSKVSFASKTALTPFGAVGVKVWVCWK